MKWLQFASWSLHFWLIIGGWFYFKLISEPVAFTLGGAVSLVLFVHHVIIKPAWCAEDGGWLGVKLLGMRTSWRILHCRKEIFLFISDLADSGHPSAVKLKEKIIVSQCDLDEDLI